ncbi:hypothetical protein [Candidatus Albibeggiatoa sp. nov. BB20]|uniref:hypothetical protein n=1 Tax=Candidatus Albibeggiatoa sp. nov. BB20 TaxID=3162723 RepID=UPI00336544E6
MDSIENILFYPIFFMMPILIIVSMIMDFRELPDKNIPSQVIHPITMLRLITWDMWLVTGVGIFLFFYPALSIWFNL